LILFVGVSGVSARVPTFVNNSCQTFAPTLRNAMQELIKIITDKVGNDNIRTVDARELHSFLEVKSKFQDWIRARINDYGFEKGKDFIVLPFFENNSKGGRPKECYHLTIEMAKELSMVERNEKGKEARKYFIDCERQAKQQPDLKAITKTDLAKMVIESESRVSELESKIEADKPKVEFAETLKASIDSVSMREFASRLNKKSLGRNKLFAWLRQHNYLDKHNIPYSRYLKAGLFEVETETYKTKAGSHTTSTTMVTPKGQIYFEKKLRG
jgi:anti-repressor protein